MNFCRLLRKIYQRWKCSVNSTDLIWTWLLNIIPSQSTEINSPKVHFDCWSTSITEQVLRLTGTRLDAKHVIILPWKCPTWVLIKATEGRAGSQAHKENVKVMSRRPKAFFAKAKRVKNMVPRSSSTSLQSCSTAGLVSYPAPKQTTTVSHPSKNDSWGQ